MVLLAKRVFPYLKGDVLVQISPPAAHNTEKTIAHAKKYVALFEEHGIPRFVLSLRSRGAFPDIVQRTRLYQDPGDP